MMDELGARIAVCAECHLTAFKLEDPWGDAPDVWVHVYSDPDADPLHDVTPTFN